MSKDVVTLVNAVKQHQIFWYRPNSPVIEVKLSSELSISSILSISNSEFLTCFNSKFFDLLFIFRCLKNAKNMRLILICRPHPDVLHTGQKHHFLSKNKIVKPFEIVNFDGKIALGGKIEISDTFKN